MNIDYSFGKQYWKCPNNEIEICFNHASGLSTCPSSFLIPTFLKLNYWLQKFLGETIHTIVENNIIVLLYFV